MLQIMNLKIRDFILGLWTKIGKKIFDFLVQLTY